jgi:hypothetical protein
MVDQVLIGGASGAWGDSPRAIPQLLGSPVNYLMMDFLAEVTMSLLARARLKAPEGGFPADFVHYLRPFLAQIAAQRVKVVSNAGGVNPEGCKAALLAACSNAGVSLRIATVTGDDVLPWIERLRAAEIREAVSQAELPRGVLTANAYLGALPIKAALDLGADIVITGRCADSALALGILMHEFGWSADDHDLLAAGSLVGHMLECGAQGVGGLHTDWESVPNWENIGYPIAECRSDGSFVLTKPAATGGLVTPGSAAEQVLYEVADPAAYALPDVVADFSQVQLTQAGPDRVRVSGARGRPPTTQYKVSATYQDGYRAVATVSIVGPQAAAKARRTAEALIARARLVFQERGLADFSATHIETLGAEASYGPLSRARASREVLLRLVVVHADPQCLELFARELGSVGISFAPGTTGIYGGRPKPTPQIRLFTFFIDKTLIPPPVVRLDADPISVPIPAGSNAVAQGGVAPAPSAAMQESADLPPCDCAARVEVPLIRLALARSGDKGDSANIAIIARDPAYVDVIRREVTVARMAEHFRHLVAGPIVRFEAPGLHAFNFLLHNALGGGSMASLRIDPQGKAYGQMALEMMVTVPGGLLGPGGLPGPVEPSSTLPGLQGGSSSSRGGTT